MALRSNEQNIKAGFHGLTTGACFDDFYLLLSAMKTHF